MIKKLSWMPLAAAVVMALPAVANAKVSAAEADRLNKDLTCVGAEMAGNKEGTIPAFSGKWLGLPPSMKGYTPHAGQHPVDAYPEDKPLFVITAENASKYAANLSDGQKAMFAKFPKTYRIPVYQTRRDFRYPDSVCVNAKKNALSAEVAADGLSIKNGSKGAVPFPIAKSGEEALYNTLLPYRAYTEVTTRDVANVTPSGSISWGRSLNINYDRVNDPENTGNAIEGVMAYSRNHIMLPEREKGGISVSNEPVNFATNKRLMWQYDPGTRRVRQLPEFGFDQPLPGTGGKMTIDQDRLFNGSPERYTWTVVGKKEVFVPANSYRIHGKDVKYADLLKQGHPNPDLGRYELRRVWVIEGKLKEGFRHVYGKRVLFADEDSWQPAISDFYDTRGQLWQHALIHHYYAPDINAFQAGSSFYHDLNSGGYVGYNLFQEAKQGPILNKGELKPAMFTPEAARAAGN